MAQSVDLEDLGAKYREGHEARVDAGERAAYFAALRGLPIVASDTPVDTGRARSGWDVTRVPGGADLFNSVPYSSVLEMGSRPHWPPHEPILRWVIRKKGIDLSGGRKHYTSIEEVPEATRRAAFAVQRKIAREGTEAHWMVRDNLPQLERILDDEVRRALEGAE